MESPYPELVKALPKLTTELLHYRVSTIRDDGCSDIFVNIEGFYNSHRLNSTLEYLSPAEMERKAACFHLFIA